MLLSITKLQNLKAIHNVIAPFTWLISLLSITKLQNLKAIHNGYNNWYIGLGVVINHKTTKFESNSQRKAVDYNYIVGCYQSQNYKIWKQFTTQSLPLSTRRLLLSITKLQNLKAIHNLLYRWQRKTAVVINHKTTKFESNSQQVRHFKQFLICCYQSQNYKIWKQFTTVLIIFPKLSTVVINHKTTKFESNSQPCHCPESELRGCYQSQNYKIWKQFTTRISTDKYPSSLLSITKLQNLKAIHKALKPDPWPLNPKSCYQSQNYKI